MLGIILATLVLGSTVTLVATRYCKSKAGLVFVVPEVTPSWEKTLVVPPPMPPMPPPPPPCICTTVVCPSPQLSSAMQCINAQRLGRPSGPWPRLQRRNPPRKVQSTSITSQVPNLLSLPPRHPRRRGEVCKLLPVPLLKQRPPRVLVEMPSRMPLTQLVPQAKKAKPSQPKPTKSAEGLDTPPVPRDPIRYPLPCKPHRYNFAPICKIRGKPSKESVLMPLPCLVPIVQVIYRRGHAPVVLIGTFDPSAPQPGRLRVEPCGGLKILQMQGKVRLPRKTAGGNGMQLPAANPTVACTFTLRSTSTQKLKRPVGPSPLWQRRNPPRTVRFTRLPNLMGLPPRRSGNVTPHARMPTPLPRTQPEFVKMPSRMPLTQLVPPTKNPKPSQPKPTKSAEGLNTPAAPHQQVTLPCKPHWYNFDPTGKIGGTPNTAPILLLVVPHLVTVIEFTRCVHRVVSIATGFCAPGRLQVEPYGFKIAISREAKGTSRDQWARRLATSSC